MGTDDGEHSEWFDLTHWLRQGCVLSPLRFDIFFAVVIHAVLIRFSEDPEIVEDLIHLEVFREENVVGVHPRSTHTPPPKNATDPPARVHSASKQSTPLSLPLPYWPIRS